MTGDAQKFSHISVASNDEDDVVIEAGAPRFRSYGEGESASQPAGDEATSAANKTAAADGGEGPSESPSRASTPAPERAVKADKPARKASAPARKGYEETTLEDLEGTKMSGMQKGIIAVALIGIVAFIVYYVAFMG
ncbi:hypothetical protein [Ellagibacter isourolithinifaciens]|uniref:hypothetical protein n=1 Tax=Ellagibacter isourolithinifaciens TaxID=2137581 RepID=UPI003FD72F05